MFSFMLAIRHNGPYDIAGLQAVHPFMTVLVFHYDDPARVYLPQQTSSPSHCFCDKVWLDYIPISFFRNIGCAAQGVQMMRFGDLNIHPFPQGTPSDLRIRRG